MNEELFETLRMELRRGSVILAVLAELKSEQYGYTLRKSLAGHGMAIDEGTLYPLLRRLESQGLLASEWREEDRRTKRFYRLSPDEVWVSSQEANNISKKILAGGATGAQRFIFDTKQDAIGGGVMVTTYKNKYSLAGAKSLDGR